MLEDPSGQFHQATAATGAVTDPPERDRTGRHLISWSRVLAGMVTGKIRVGSPTPVRGFPAWLTPEILRGGFATGRAAAAGPLEPDEITLAHHAGVPASRARIFEWFLTQEGLRKLDAWASSGLYRLELPEHGALLTVAWLLKAGHHADALSVVDSLRPWATNVRFWPYEVHEAEAPGVQVATVPQVASRLERKKPQRHVEAEREVLLVWNPFTDKVLAHWWATRSSTGLVGAVLPPDWLADAQDLLDEYQSLADVHTRTTRHANPADNLQILLSGLHAFTRGKADARTMGRVRAAVANMVAKRGEPGSKRLADLRAAQMHIAAAPSHAAVARDAAARLRASGQTGAVADPLALLTGAAGLELPSVRTTVRQATRAPVSVLLDAGIIRSAEMLAELAPQLTAETVGSRYTDPEAGLLGKRLYQAFRNRRSTLLLNQQSQVSVSALPWFTLLERAGVQEQRQDLAHLQAVELAALALRHFPGTAVPNSLVRELSHLFALAGEDVLLTFELAADIFTGSFSPPFLRAAQQAATVVGGTLYARYYRIDYDAILSMEPATRRPSRFRAGATPDPPDFDSMVRSRAQVTRLRWFGDVASRGRVIEQAQLLTTHNLVALVEAGFTLDWPIQARGAWNTTRYHLAKTTGRRTLRHRKNAAYAWRQTLVYLALCSPPEIAAFVNDETLTHGLSPEVCPQTETLVRDLRAVLETGVAPEHPFLGWVGGSGG